ncbi:MAG: cobalamin-dependent protein, partial [Candidatus Omnitrophica bacterium]|nr:cobalamin-dependent protein [Candidatus Omnitrophota bacterium]
MRIALVFPGINETGFNKGSGKAEYSWINHGLCSLSACAKKEGHTVELIDLREFSGWDAVSGAVRRIKPRVVGITMMSVDFEYATQTAKLVKSCDPCIKVVTGGPHPSIAPREVAADAHIDYVVKGEGEISFVKLIDDIDKGRLPDKIISGQPPELDKLPFIDRTLFKFKESPIDTFLEPPFVTIIAGRGCLYNCSFCQPAERKIFGTGI